MNLKEIRDHILSINNLKKVTSIVDKMSIIKLKKNLVYLNSFKNHLNELEEILCIALNEFKIKSPKNLKNFINNNPLLVNKKSKKSILALFYSSNRGLCGSYNHNIYANMLQFYQEMKKQNQNVTFYSIGKKAALKLKRKAIPVSILTEISEKSIFLDENFNKIAEQIFEDFQNEKIDQFISFYTDNDNVNEFKKVFLLPFSINKYLIQSESYFYKKDNDYVIYNIDNNLEVFLSKIIKEIIKSQIYYFLIKSTISENLVRHLTTSRASEKSNDLIHDLNIQYNKLRQNKITQEISEIIRSSKSIIGK